MVGLYDNCYNCPIKLYTNGNECPLALCLYDAYDQVNTHVDVETIYLWETGKTIEEIAEVKNQPVNKIYHKIDGWRDRKRKAGLLI